ncbi:MAG: hypothetical protein IKV85_10125 [Ruminococcus sp.]|nr:hypothetical protein [Ruminococcus sp.]
MSKIKVKFSFLLFNALVFIFRDSSLIMGFYGACILHEAGHIAAVYFTGGCVRSIEFGWTGIKMTASASETKGAAIIVQLCGPLANIAAFLLLTAWGRGGYFVVFCLIEGLVNLLPYKFLDGGAILEILADFSCEQQKFHLFNTILKVFFSTILVALFIFYSDTLNKIILTVLIN